MPYIDQHDIFNLLSLGYLNQASNLRAIINFVHATQHAKINGKTKKQKKALWLITFQTQTVALVHIN